MKKKEYYREELEKSSREKMQSIERQKFYTGGSIALMFMKRCPLAIPLYPCPCLSHELGPEMAGQAEGLPVPACPQE